MLDSRRLLVILQILDIKIRLETSNNIVDPQKIPITNNNPVVRLAI